MNSTDQARRIYMTLQRQSFSNWYSDNGTFGKHITGDEKLPEEQILDSIKKMFNLTDDPVPVKLARGRLITPVGVFDVTIRLKGLSPIFGYLLYECVIITSSVPEKVKVGHTFVYSEADIQDLRSKQMLVIFKD